MEIEVVKSEKEYLELVIKDDDYGLANALKEILLESGDVEFAAYRMDHPQASFPVLMIRMKKGNPVFALRSAVKKLKKEASEFKDVLKSVKKSRKQ